MKNNSKIIILMVILTILAIGLTYFLINILKNGAGFNFHFDFGASEEITGDPIYKEEYELGQIENININYDCGNIYFKESDTSIIKLEIYGDKEKDIFNVSTDNLILDINYKINNKIKFFTISNIKRKIVIYVPSTYANTITIKNDAGNTKICDLEYASVNIKSDAGDISVGNINNAKIKCDSGNVNLGNVLNKLEIECDAGNVEIEKALIKEDSFIKCDFGNVTIKDKSDIFVDAKCDLGNEKIETNNTKSDIKLKIDCDCGNISVK